jgi:hypothetical protein
VPFDQLAKGGRVPLPGPRDQVDVAHTDCRHTRGFDGWGGATPDKVSSLKFQVSLQRGRSGRDGRDGGWAGGAGAGTRRSRTRRLTLG